MAKTIPHWIQYRYANMLKYFGNNQFTLDECSDFLKEKRAVTTVILSKLRRNGWIEIELDKDDARKKKYRLIEPDKIMLAIAEGGYKNEERN